MMNPKKQQSFYSRLLTSIGIISTVSSFINDCNSKALDGSAEVLRQQNKPFIWAVSDDSTFLYVNLNACRAGNSIEFETIASRVRRPIWSECKRCYSGTKRWTRIHITPGIAMGSAEGVITEVYAIVEAH